MQATKEVGNMPKKATTTAEEIVPITPGGSWVYIWGFRAPMINDYGSVYGDNWLLFTNPFIMEKKEFNEMFSQECQEYRLFYWDMQEDAEKRWRNDRGDIWDQFWFQIENCPKTKEELFNKYLNILDKRNKRWLYNICEEEDEE